MNIDLDQNQIKALKYLIRSSPTGEIQDVLLYISSLTGSIQQLLENEEILTTLRKWYESHKYHISLPNGKIGMVSASGYSSSGQEERLEEKFTYYDSTIQTVFSFDPVSLKANIVSEEPMAIQTSQFRQDLIQELDKYLDKAYSKGKAVYSVVQGESQEEQTIEISCQNYKLDSFWSGEWLSTWFIKNGKLSGELKIKCHYFEMGNMQFNLEKEYDIILVKDITKASSVVDSIKNIEEKYQLDLDEMYENIQNNLLKRMRRAVPVTGQKFDWDKPVGIFK